MNSPRSTLNQHRQWLLQAEGMVVRELDYIDEDLAEGSLGSLANVSDSLGMLATYHGIEGEVAICSGDASGWRAVSNALVYRYWALKLKAHGFSATHFLGSLNKGPNLTNQLSNAGCLLAAFIAADRRDLAGSVAEMLAGMLRVEGAIDAHYLKRRQFEPFMLWLYGRYSAQATARVGYEFGVYQQIIDCWADEQRLGGALREVCQHHMANIDDQGGEWDPEFKNPPFYLLPFEAVAILKVRQKLGLVSPVIEHPLICTQTIAVEQLVLEPDDVVRKVEAAYEALRG